MMTSSTIHCLDMGISIFMHLSTKRAWSIILLESLPESFNNWWSWDIKKRECICQSWTYFKKLFIYYYLSLSHKSNNIKKLRKYTFLHWSLTYICYSSVMLFDHSKSSKFYSCFTAGGGCTTAVWYVIILGCDCGCGTLVWDGCFCCGSYCYSVSIFIP